jgi:hypothetical protein
MEVIYKISLVFRLDISILTEEKVDLLLRAVPKAEELNLWDKNIDTSNL